MSLTNNSGHSQQPKIAFIGFMLDHNSSFMRGPALAPPFIREALHSDSSSLWSEHNIELNDTIIQNAGDLFLNDDKEAFQKIESAISKLLDDNLIPVSLGGDHSITYPILKAFHKKYPNLHVLHLDAHPDLYQEFAGNRFSHASPFARIMEDKLVQRLTQMGIRSLNEHQRQQVKRFGVEMLEFAQHRKLIFESDMPIYVSFDMDVLDPAFAPGVSHPEPGGLSTRQAIDIIHSIKGKIVGADIVELNPKRDPLGISAMAAAKILKELASVIVKNY